MDEYLSKPLNQVNLIQTILKCATLGGNLLEASRDRRSSPKDDVTVKVPGADEVERPSLESRALTTTGPIIHGSLASPAVLEKEEDPLQGVSTRHRDKRFRS